MRGIKADFRIRNGGSSEFVQEMGASGSLPEHMTFLEDGEELVVVSRTLGHSTISTTADVYAHVTPATLQRSAERMDGILRSRADTA